MVTWGINTVHNIGSTPAAPPQGATPSTGFSFGGSSTSAPAPAPFGSPAPSTGLFGSSFGPSPAPAPLFGSAAAPSTGLFSAPGPAPTTSPFSFPSSTFGATAPAGGLFGSTNPPSGGGLFGSSFAAPQAPPPQQPQIPAQAALQAHLDAEARQEEARVTSALNKLFQDYTGSTVADKRNSAPFTLVHYTDATPEILQQQWLQGTLIHQAPRPVVPPRPWQISDDDWNLAVARNPNFTAYMPSAIVGADALQSRLTYQQDAANTTTQRLQVLREAVQSLQQQRASQHLKILKERHQQQRQRMVEIMRKVEIVRCFHLPLQSQEIQTFQQLIQLNRFVEQQLKPLVLNLQEQSQQLSAQKNQRSNNQQALATATNNNNNNIDEENELVVEQVLNGEAEGLAKLETALKRQVRDLKLIQQRLATTTSTTAGAASSLRR